MYSYETTKRQSRLRRNRESLPAVKLENFNDLHNVQTQRTNFRRNNTGLDSVKAHYNSSRPAQFKVPAYAKGNSRTSGPYKQTNCGRSCSGGLNDTQTGARQNIFANAYHTVTFKRKSFSVDDRVAAWWKHARAENRIWWNSRLPTKAQFRKNIREMGYAIQGLHLRHVIPYSDIAGAFYVATSDTALRLHGQEYVDGIRARIYELAKILKVDMSGLCGHNEGGILPDFSSWNGCLRDVKRRKIVQKLFHQLAHSPENLFYGDASANMVLGNRPDITEEAKRVLTAAKVNKLYDWWKLTMGQLGLNPKEQEERIYCLQKEDYITRVLPSHDLSRTLGVLVSDPSELDRS